MYNDKINFKVNKIEKAMKTSNIIATVQFEGSEKEYNYIRKYYVKDAFTGIFVIDGCHISFDLISLNVLKIEKKYETKGYKKMNGGTSSKTKTKLEEIGTLEIIPKIETPKIEVKLEENGEVRHEKYEQIKTCLECGIPVYLAGPAGSGKNYTVEQIANELGWNFYFSNSVQQEYKLTGFIDAGGCSMRLSSTKLAMTRMIAYSSWMRWMLQFLKYWFS